MRGDALDALVAELLGDVGKLHDEVATLNRQIPQVAQRFEQLNNKLLSDRTAVATTFEKLKSAQLNDTGKAEKAVAIAVIAACVGFVVVLALGIQLGRAIAPNSGALTTDDLQKLSGCSGAGWRAKEKDGETYCYPHSYTGPDGKHYIDGWHIVRTIN